MGVTVSYVVTLYNKTRYLPFLLAGLAQQSSVIDKEFIFVDDGSTDDTVAVLRGMVSGWKNVIVLEQRNAGPAVATNRGLAVAQGEFIKPVDGDDMLLPWATTYLLDAIHETGCDVAFGDMGLQGKYDPASPLHEALSGLEQPPISLLPEPSFLAKSFKNAQTNPSTWLARRSLVEATRGCDEAIFIQDYSIELKLGYQGKVVRLKNALFKMPVAAPGRLSDQEAQILHDVNLALVRFVAAHPALEKDLKAYAISRAAGRAWAWARRHGGESYLSKSFLTLLASKLKMVGVGPDFERQVCEPFRKSTPLRLVGYTSSR